MIEDVLLSLAAGDLDRARRHARSAADHSPLGAALDRHLQRSPADVYAEPTGFEAFIDNGGNVELYARTIAALRAEHHRLSPQRVLDIGCGDGRVTAGSRVDVGTHIDAIEPSPALLANALVAIGSGCTGHNTDVVAFLDRIDEQRWDLVQSTFALHNLSPRERRSVLDRLRTHLDHVVIAEFDIAPFEDGSRAHAAYAASAYELGIQEYDEHPEAIDGFLLPILIGQFDPGRPRHTYEQSANGWVTDFETAGYRDVEVVPITGYWWGPAVLVRAHS